MKMYKKLIIGAFAFGIIFSIGNKAQALTLNQTNVSVTTGQNTTVYASNVYSYLLISSNSNPNVATLSISGNTINIYGVTNGSTTANVCDGNSLYSCNLLYITVNGYGNNSGTLSLSQTNLSLSVGQTTTVTAYNNYYNYGTLYVLSNSNPNVATATVSNNNLISIYGLTSGSTNVLICQNSNLVSCGTVYVTVSGGYGYNPIGSTGLNLSNIVLSIGSSATISSTNNYNYYNSGLSVSSNSNPIVASAIATSSTSVIPGCYGNNIYSITTGQLCTSINNYYSYNNDYNSNYLPAGCYAGYQYSILTGQLCSRNSGSNYNNNGSVVITALSAGYDTIVLCQNGNACSTLNITVSGYGTPLNSYYNMPATSIDNSPTSDSGIPVVYSSSSAD